MKKIIFLITAGFALSVNAQNYSFSKSNEAYFSLSGATNIVNGDWTEFEKSIKMPFTFKYWGGNLGDSIFLNDWGSLSIDKTYGEEITFLGEEMSSRGVGKSFINYLVSGTSPNRIFKVEYKNIGFDGNLPSLEDSASVQCWLYETSNIIEFRYGPNRVQTDTWLDNGTYVSIYNSNFTKFISVEGDPLNPTINKTEISNVKSVTGMPMNGTVYKFTPPSNTGIIEPTVKIRVINNKVSLPASMVINSINIYNTSGQLVQSAINTEEINLSNLNHGIYFIVISTNDGIISEKKFL